MGFASLSTGVVCVLLSGVFAELSAVTDQVRVIYRTEGSTVPTPHNTACIIPGACSQVSRLKR